MPKIYSAGDTVPAADLNGIVKVAGGYAASATGNDSYVITVTPTPGSLTAGDVFYFKADVANTGSATLNVNSTGVKTIKKINGDDLITGDILAGQLCQVQYDGTNYILLSASSIIPKTVAIAPTPALVHTGTTTINHNTGTSMSLCAYVVPFQITVNKISINVTSVGGNGTLDISCYSEDGQTRLFSVTTATISATGVVTTAVSAVTLPPGIYYIGININGAAAMFLDSFTFINNLRGLSGEPTLVGTLTITADTPPTTITPTSITAATAGTIIRLDN